MKITEMDAKVQSASQAMPSYEPTIQDKSMSRIQNKEQIFNVFQRQIIRNILGLVKA